MKMIRIFFLWLVFGSKHNDPADDGWTRLVIFLVLIGLAAVFLL